MVVPGKNEQVPVQLPSVRPVPRVDRLERFFGQFPLGPVIELLLVIGGEHFQPNCNGEFLRMQAANDIELCLVMLRIVVDFSDEDDIGPFDVLYDFRQIGGLLVAYPDKLCRMGGNARNNQKDEDDYRTMK